MTVFNTQISDNADDGQERADTAWSENGLDSDGNRVGDASDAFDMGMRFRNVTIPQGATINSAVIQVFMKFITGSSDIVTRMQGFDEDDTAAFSSSARPSQRTQTTALIDRTYTSSEFVDETYLSLDDCTNIVQEIVDRGGWSSGNAMGFVLKDNGSAGGNRWQFQDFGRQPGNAALITIDYTAGGATGIVVLRRRIQGY